MSNIANLLAEVEFSSLAPPPPTPTMSPEVPRALPKARVSMPGLHSRRMEHLPSKTIGKHLDEFDVPNENGHTFADIVYLQLWGERAPDDWENTAPIRPAAGKKRAHQEEPAPKPTVSVLEHAKADIPSVKRPLTKKVMANSGKATCSSASKPEFSDDEDEQPALKKKKATPRKVTAEKKPAVNKRFAKVVGAKVKKNRHDDDVPVSMRAARLTPAQIKARKEGK